MASGSENNGGQPPGDKRDEPSLPTLLAQAGALGATLNLQQAALATFLRAQVAAVPGLPPAEQDPAAPSGLPDFPKVLKQLQDELTAAGGRLAALGQGLGAKIPAGVGADGVLAAVSAFAAGAVNQLLVAQGQPALPPEPAAPTAPPNFPDIIKRLVGEQATGQQRLDALYVAHGLDPKASEAALARLMPVAPVPPPLATSGLPGGDQLAAMQANAQKLEQLVAALAAKITPR